MDLFTALEQLGRPDVSRKPWMDSKQMFLVNTEAAWEALVDRCYETREYALDLETTGLDNRVFDGRTVDQIVGVCISPDGESGYYVPLRHPEFQQHCLGWTAFTRGMKRLLADHSIIVYFHNAKFDHEFLQFNGGEPLGEWDDPNQWHDSLILAYLRDTRARDKRLKHLARKELGMEMIELNELFTKEDIAAYGKNFSRLDPTWEPALWYATSDAICTFLLNKKLKPQALDAISADIPSQNFIYSVEKLCLAATRWMERNGIPISRSKVRELIILGQREFLPALTDVYAACSERLGRDIMPGFVKLLLDPKSPVYFDPEVVEDIDPDFAADWGLTNRMHQARRVAITRGMDRERQIYTKTVLRLADPNVSHNQIREQGFEQVDFPEVYDILVPENLGLLFRELEVPGLVGTATGQVATSSDVLEALVERTADLKFMPRIKRFREILKAIGSNLEKIYLDTHPKRCPTGTVKCNFEGFKVDTARFSTPQKEKEDHTAKFTGEIRWNVHSIPATYDPARPECMGRIREVVTAPPGYTIATLDFSGEELRVATNLSGESKWITEFFRCSACSHSFDRGGPNPPPPLAPPPFCPKCGSDKIGDLHTLTALSVFGDHIQDTPEFKQRRQEAKSLNFAMAYGGGPSAAMRAVGCSKEEGSRIKVKFDGSYPQLQNWWKSQHAFARKHKMVLTVFGRRYLLPDIDSPVSGFRSKAERNAVNGPVQGGSADIMKLSMGLIYREFKKRGWLESVRMIITIHDELVFVIKNELLGEAIPVIEQIMTRESIKRLPWRVPLTSDIEVGQDWTVPYHLQKIKYGKKKMPEWLAPFMPGWVLPEVVNPPAPEPPPVETPKEAAPEPPPVVGEASFTEPTPEPQVKPPPPGTKTVEFTLLRREMTEGMVAGVARALYSCKDRGTCLVVIKDEVGEVLWGRTDWFVNAVEIETAFRMLRTMR